MSHIVPLWIFILENVLGADTNNQILSKKRVKQIKKKSFPWKSFLPTTEAVKREKCEVTLLGWPFDNICNPGDLKQQGRESLISAIESGALKVVSKASGIGNLIHRLIC